MARNLGRKLPWHVRSQRDLLCEHLKQAGSSDRADHARPGPYLTANSGMMQTAAMDAVLLFQALQYLRVCLPHQHILRD